MAQKNGCKAMTQKGYDKAKLREGQAEKQPSKQHKQPLVVTDIKGNPHYTREE